ncbi:6,7-dimethyl-8-ribityllumazine synthase [Flavihumibacter petaseus]|uniref:6,7-dimethyl-8-ribityllumazine synthase n=1 Tax=Flavihumibacter petaseus NBRC 106054 TaxID=1220578 RepID=A0A0E9N761_9BACT|nr:6,7-dimethyl-8-ribityllumazine synthase [Flavihumibacter petaseus]GAO45638.1 6,7-dimethyl-8-ribityllumazine synthase [Flavihumibacter petaseus NBRC 106054]
MASQGNTQLQHLATGILPPDACVVIVKTEWNAAIVDELEAGCRRVFEAQGISNIETLVVPGAVEIPFGIKNCWESRKYRDIRPLAYIALGCVIKGDTPHFDYVCQSVTYGITQLNIQMPVPVIFGILTVNTEQQAHERIGGIHGHKGEEAAITAIKMISLQQQLKR